MTLFEETFHSETKVKGKLIDKMSATNMRQMDGNRCFYNVKYYEYDDSGKEKNRMEFNVTHDGRNGAAELKRIIYTEVVRRSAK